MKKLSVLGILLVLLLTFVIAAPAQAAANTVKEPFSDTMVLTNGKVVEIEGFIRITTSTTYDVAGGYHEIMTVNLIRCSGTDVDTGEKYLVVGESASSFYQATSTFPKVATYLLHMKFIGSGNAPNESASLAIHVVINANGEVAVYFTKGNI